MKTTREGFVTSVYDGPQPLTLTTITWHWLGDKEVSCLRCDVHQADLEDTNKRFVHPTTYRRGLWGVCPVCVPGATNEIEAP